MRLGAIAIYARGGGALEAPPPSGEGLTLTELELGTTSALACLWFKGKIRETGMKREHVVVLF